MAPRGSLVLLCLAAAVRLSHAQTSDSSWPYGRCPLVINDADFAGQDLNNGLTDTRVATVGDCCDRCIAQLQKWKASSTDFPRPSDRVCVAWTYWPTSNICWLKFSVLNGTGALTIIPSDGSRTGSILNLWRTMESDRAYDRLTSEIKPPLRVIQRFTDGTTIPCDRTSCMKIEARLSSSAPPPPSPSRPPPRPPPSTPSPTTAATPTTPSGSGPALAASGSPDSTSSGGGLTPGAIGGIIGGVAGGIALLALLAVLLLLRRRRRRRHFAVATPDSLAGKESGPPHNGLAGMELLEAGNGSSWKQGCRSSHASDSDAIAVPGALLLDAPPEPLLPLSSSRLSGTPPASGSYMQVLRDSTTAVVTFGPGGSARIARAPVSASAASAASQGMGNTQAISIASRGSVCTPQSGSSSAVSLPELPWSDWQLRADDIILARDGAGEPVKLGSGAYGTVFQGTIDGVTEVAVKTFKESLSQAQQANILREVAILKGCSDPNIVQFLGACFAGGKIQLVTELMAAGDLWHALAHHQGTGALKWYRRGRSIALDVARGLHYLHRRRIVHFDLKSPNVLLSRAGLAKISDVGFAHILSNSHLSKPEASFTFAWAAPEVLMAGPCTNKVDIFSYGVVLWEIVTGEQPRRGQLRACRTPEECPVEVAALIQHCLSHDSEARPSCKDIVEVLTSVQHLPEPGAAPAAAWQA